MFSESSDVLQLNVNKKSIHDGIEKVGRSCETRMERKKMAGKPFKSRKKGGRSCNCEWTGNKSKNENYVDNE